MYLASLKQTIRLYPIVLIAIAMTILNELFPEEHVVIGLAITILCYVLQYEAFSKCLPADIRIPVPALNKGIGFFSKFAPSDIKHTPHSSPFSFCHRRYANIS